MPDKNPVPGKPVVDSKKPQPAPTSPKPVVGDSKKTLPASNTAKKSVSHLTKAQPSQSKSKKSHGQTLQSKKSQGGGKKSVAGHKTDKDKKKSHGNPQDGQQKSKKSMKKSISPEHKDTGEPVNVQVIHPTAAEDKAEKKAEKKAGKSNKPKRPKWNQCLDYEDILVRGRHEFGDCREERSGLPSWISIELARRGQTFARDWFYGVYYAHLVSFVLLLGITHNRRFMYYTDKSNSPDKALKRYLATLLQIRLWYREDIATLGVPNSPLRSSINHVRNVHKKIGVRVQVELPDLTEPLINKSHFAKGSPSLLLGKMKGRTSNKTKKLNKERTQIWRAFKEDLKNSKDLHSAIQMSNVRAHKYLELEDKVKGIFYYFSQFDMAYTLWSFVALPIIMPEKMGLKGYVDEDLWGFVHFWGVIGWAMGLRDDYNICLNPNLTIVKSYCFQMLYETFLPPLLQPDFETRLMWESLLDGMEYVTGHIRFDLFLSVIIVDIIGMKDPQLQSVMSKKSRWIRRKMKMSNFWMRYRCCRLKASRDIHRWLDKAAKKYLEVRKPSNSQAISKQAYF